MYNAESICFHASVRESLSTTHSQGQYMCLDVCTHKKLCLAVLRGIHDWFRSNKIQRPRHCIRIRNIIRLDITLLLLWGKVQIRLAMIDNTNDCGLNQCFGTNRYVEIRLAAMEDTAWKVMDVNFWLGTKISDNFSFRSESFYNSSLGSSPSSSLPNEGILTGPLSVLFFICNASILILCFSRILTNDEDAFPCRSQENQKMFSPADIWLEN